MDVNVLPLLTTMFGTTSDLVIAIMTMNRYHLIKSKSSNFTFQNTYRVCHRFGLVKQDDIFGSVLTTFEYSSIFGGSWGSTKNWLKPKTEPPLGNLANPNP